MPEQTISYPIRNSLYLNITDRCTLACRFCPKNQGSLRVHDFDLSLATRPAVDDIVTAVGDPTRYDEIVFCGYGEPTLRLKTLMAVARDIKRRGGRVRLNTDGLANLVHKRDVLPELADCIDAVSVSLNAQDEATYIRHCVPALPGSYAAMLDFVARAGDHIGSVAATAIDGLDGVDIGACRRLAARLGVTFRRRTLNVVG